MAEVGKVRITLEVKDKGSAVVAKFGRTTEKSVKRANQAMRQARDEMGRFAEKAKSSLGSMGVAAGAFAGIMAAQLGRRALTAMNDFAKSVVRTGATFESKMAQIGAITGATADQMAAMEKIAFTLGETTKFSATQAAEGLFIMSRAGFSVDEAIKVLPATLNLAAAGALDLGEAADIATAVLKGYGIETENLAVAGDVLTATFTNSNTDLRMLGEAFKLAGPVAKSAGVEFNDLAAAMGIMANAGFQGSLAGTALRGAMIRLANPTDEARDLLNKMSISLTDASGKFVGFESLVEQLGRELPNLGGQFEQTGALATLFGQRAGPAMAALVQQGAAALGDLRGELDESGGKMGQVAKDMEDTVAGASRRMAAAIEGLQQKIFKEIAPDFKRLIDEDINPSIKELGDLLAPIAKVLVAIGKGVRFIQETRIWKDLRDTATALEFYAEKLGLVGKALPEVAEDTKKFGGISKETADLIAEADGVLKRHRETVAGYADDVSGTTKLVSEQTESLDENTEALKENTAAKFTAKTETEKIRDAMFEEMGIARDLTDAVDGVADAHLRQADGITKAIEATKEMTSLHDISMSGGSSIGGGASTRGGRGRRGGGGGGGGADGAVDAGTLTKGTGFIDSILKGSTGTVLVYWFQRSMDQALSLFKSGDVGGLQALHADLKSRRGAGTAMAGGYNLGAASDKLQFAIAQLIGLLGGGGGGAGFSAGGASPTQGFGAPAAALGAGGGPAVPMPTPQTGGGLAIMSPVVQSQMAAADRATEAATVQVSAAGATMSAMKRVEEAAGEVIKSISGLSARSSEEGEAKSADATTFNRTGGLGGGRLG